MKFGPGARLAFGTGIAPEVGFELEVGLVQHVAGTEPGPAAGFVPVLWTEHGFGTEVEVRRTGLESVHE